MLLEGVFLPDLAPAPDCWEVSPELLIPSKGAEVSSNRSFSAESSSSSGSSDNSKNSGQSSSSESSDSSAN